MWNIDGLMNVFFGRDFEKAHLVLIDFSMLIGNIKSSRHLFIFSLIKIERGF